LTTRPRNAFSLIELLVVIAIVAVLASVLIPIFEQVWTDQRSKVGDLNIRKLGYAMLLYLQDNEEQFPRSGDDCLSRRTAPKFFKGLAKNQCGGDGWQDAVGPYTNDGVFGKSKADKGATLFVSPDDHSETGGAPTTTHGTLEDALSLGGPRPLRTGHNTDFRTTDGNLSLLFNNMLSHRVAKWKALDGTVYANASKRDLCSNGLPLAAIKDPAQCVVFITGHGGWDVTHIDPNSIVSRDWTSSTDLQNKWHHAYGISNESFFVVPVSYSGLSFIHSGLPFPGNGINVVYIDAHTEHKSFLTKGGGLALCRVLPWPKSMDPLQRGAEKDSCSDPDNPVGAGWETSNWF
jgi:prepilin-type N-terminal cleavage/methylation domain-containing protein